jgi:predicted dehydrogenase
MTLAMPINMAFIGCGGMARHHLRRILASFPDTTVPVVCEPSATAYEESASLFAELGHEPRPGLDLFAPL